MSRLETTHPDTPQSFYCPITHEIMRDPVICADGHSYERDAISKWFENKDTSPVTNLPLLNKTLIPNFSLKSAIQEFFQNAGVLDVKSTTPQITRPVEPSAQSVLSSQSQQQLTVVTPAAVEGDYPIHCAIRQKNVAVLIQLLNGDNLNLKNKAEKTAIELAADLGYWDLVIQIARAYKPSEYSRDQNARVAYNRVLRIASMRNKTVEFIALKNAGASTTCDIHIDNYPIHDAIAHRNIIVLSVLLDRNNLNLKNNAGETAIELAADLGYWDLVIRIAKAYQPSEYSWDQNARAAYNRVLGIAASEGQTDAFTALKNAGAITTNAVVVRKQKSLDNTNSRTSNSVLFPKPKTPSIAELKKTYRSKVTFFSFQVGTIFEGSDVDKVIQRLIDRGNGEASEKTLKVFGLR